MGAGPASLDRRARSAAARLRIHIFDEGSCRRRHDAHADSFVSSAGPVLEEEVDLHPRHGRPVPLQARGRQHEGNAGQGLRRVFRRHGCAARARTAGFARAQGRRARTFDRHQLARQRRVRTHDDDRQASDRDGRRQHGDGLLPHRAAARAETMSQSSCARRFDDDESVAVGKRRCDARRTSRSSTTTSPKSNSSSRTANSKG